MSANESRVFGVVFVAACFALGLAFGLFGCQVPHTCSVRVYGDQDVIREIQRTDTAYDVESSIAVGPAASAEMRTHHDDRTVEQEGDVEGASGEVKK